SSRTAAAAVPASSEASSSSQPGQPGRAARAVMVITPPPGGPVRPRAATALMADCVLILAVSIPGSITGSWSAERRVWPRLRLKVPASKATSESCQHRRASMNDRDATPNSLEPEEHRLKLRNLTLDDYPQVRRIMETVYPTLGAWQQDQFAAQLSRFPEGQICIEDNGRVVAAALTLIVNYDRFGDRHTYEQITGNGYFTTHDPTGDVLYGVDVFVDPAYRHMRLGRRLYDARKELCRNLNLRAIIAGGRIPGYRDYADRMSPEEYIEQVRRREIYDP